MKISELIEEELRTDVVSFDDVTAAITARLHECVKPLEWDKHPDDQEWYARLAEIEGDTFERGFMILPVQSHFTLYDGFAFRARVMGHFTLVQEAKAAAQAHYAKQIIEGLNL